MADDSCFACKKSLSELVDGDSCVYRRFCCGIRAHHSCIGFTELSDCEACRTPPSSVFIWFPVIREPQVIIIDYEPPSKKAKTAEFVCSICLENQWDNDDRLIKTRAVNKGLMYLVSGNFTKCPQIAKIPKNARE